MKKKTRRSKWAGIKCANPECQRGAEVSGWCSTDYSSVSRWLCRTADELADYMRRRQYIGARMHIVAGRMFKRNVVHLRRRAR